MYDPGKHLLHADAPAPKIMHVSSPIIPAFSYLPSLGVSLSFPLASSQPFAKVFYSDINSGDTMVICCL